MERSETYHHRRLDCGIDFAALEMPGRHTVALNVRVAAGMVDEDESRLGLGGIVARPGLTVLEDRDPEIQDHEVVFAIEDLGPADERPTEADEAGLLLQLPQGGLGHGFTVFDASTREGPSALSRVGRPANHEQFVGPGGHSGHTQRGSEFSRRGSGHPQSPLRSSAGSSPR